MNEAKLQNMTIEWVNPDTLTPYEHNPRINDQAIDAVWSSIAEFGWRQPIVVDKNRVIVVGHTRWKGAIKNNCEKVPVVVAADLSDAQIKAYRLADNRTGELSEWDFTLLPLELDELKQMDFSMDDFGFSDAEFEKLMKDGDPVASGETDPDAVPEAPEVPRSETGKIYHLGRHRLLCGDATDANQVERLIGGKQADLWLTDPPYNVAYTGKTADALTIQNDSMEDSRFLDFLTNSFRAAVVSLKPGGAFYIWHADSEGFNFRSACRASSLQVRQCLIWNKNSLVMGRQDYQWKHEPCLYGWKDGAAHYFCPRRDLSTVIDMPKPSRSEDHPTMKPVGLFVDLIKNSTRRNETVLDTFCGSGTTVIAAEQTERTAFVMELDPHYCDVIRRRYAEFVHGEGCDWAALTPAE